MAKPEPTNKGGILGAHNKAIREECSYFNSIIYRRELLLIW